MREPSHDMTARDAQRRSFTRKALIAALCGLLVAGLAGCAALPGALLVGQGATSTLASNSDTATSDGGYADIEATGAEAARTVFSRAALSCKTHVSISRSLLITQADLESAIDELRFTPEYLCSTGKFSFKMAAPEGEDVFYASSLSLSYDFDPLVVPIYRAEMLDVANSVIAQVVTPSMSDYEKALALHDWIVENCAYDIGMTRYSTYDALVGRCATCQGYCQAYLLLLEKAGVPCEYVSSAAMDHCWNMVQIEGNWYHVDVTWDDPILDEGVVLDEALHTHFLKSDDTFAELGYHDWQAKHAAPADYPE